MTSSTTMTTTAEAFRPKLHFATEGTWINDPNGLIHHGGLYHLYYQNNPFGSTHGNLSWGHATSPDLMTWEEHGVAIPCDEQEEVYSGSIVFDAENTSGFGTTKHAPLVAIYTSAYRQRESEPELQAQSLAYSLDGGYTWTKHLANPVLSRGSANFRDPKVFRYTGVNGPYWVMAAVEALDYQVHFYRSADLKEWEHLSTFGPANATGGIWECPDLFPLAVDGDPANTKWVLTVNLNPGGPNGGSAGQYFIGHFDGQRFHSDTTVTEGPQDPTRVREYGWLDWGRDYYAAVSFSDAPAGRRIMLGWMNNWDYANHTPTAPWRSPMALPRELELKRIDGTVTLVQTVAPEVQESNFDAPTAHIGPVPVTEDGLALPEAAGTVQIIDAEFSAGSAQEFGLVLRGGESEGTTIVISPRDGTVTLDRTASGDTGFHTAFPSADTAPISGADGRYAMRICVDRCSVEVFVDQGTASLTSLVFPSPASRAVSAYASGGTATLESLRIRTID